MSDRRLCVAFTAGAMYDRLYTSLARFEQISGVQVEVGFRGPHSELNAHLASLKELPYHLVSTHTKYAPSQLSFLAPLDGVAELLELDQFYAPLVELARVEGRLVGIPRNVDVKLLHYRTDLIGQAPETWDELADTARSLSSAPDRHGFVFTGTNSGLFGMFYELAEMAGASLFPASNVPVLNNEGGWWALELIAGLYRSGAVPCEVIDWHFEEAHRCFLNGHAAMLCDWPGYFGEYRDATSSKVSGRFALARMPSTRNGVHKAYSGCHTFALTRRGLERSDAVELLRFLTAPEQQLIAARHGSVPTRPVVLHQVLSEADEFEAERWKLLNVVIASDMLIPPRLSYYPEVEDIIWRSVRAAMAGEKTIDTLLAMERRISECHRKNTERK